MPNRQIIFVVETNDKQIDDIYIKKLINSYYDLSDNNTTIKFVHMCGKGNYKSNSVLTKINSYVKENSKGKNIIIYCFDTDRIDNDTRAISFLEEVENYCKTKGYDLVWFCHEIENVFLGKTVSDEQKFSESIKYKKSKVVYDKRIIKNLSTTDDKPKTNGKSNIILVLNKHLKKL